MSIGIEFANRSRRPGIFSAIHATNPVVDARVTLFPVASHLSVPVQAADLCIYCINRRFHRPKWGMNAVTRPQIEEQFSGWIERPEWVWKFRDQEGTARRMHGIVFVQNPYGPGEP